MPQRTRTDFSPPQRPDPRRADSKAIVAAILEATVALPPDASVNAIAERAGVGIASLYRYFPNREAILAELGRNLHSRVEPMAREILRQASSLEQAIEGCCRLGLERSYGERHIIEFLAAQMPYTWHQQEAEAINRVMLRLVVETLDRFLVGTPDQMHARAFSMVMMVRGVSTWRTLLPELAPSVEACSRPLQAALLACALDGLERRTVEPPMGSG